jgi:hypothetical protein
MALGGLSVLAAPWVLASLTPVMVPFCAVLCCAVLQVRACHPSGERAEW